MRLCFSRVKVLHNHDILVLLYSCDLRHRAKYTFFHNDASASDFKRRGNLFDHNLLEDNSEVELFRVFLNKNTRKF